MSIGRKRLLSSSRDGKTAIQVDEATVSIYHETQATPFAVLNTCITLQGLAVDSNYLCCWSTSEIQTYSVQNKRCIAMAEIPISLQTLAIHGESLYIAQNRSLLITDLEGTLRMTTRLSEADGNPKFLHAISNVLTIFTDKGTIKVMDISKKEPRPLYSHRVFVGRTPLGQSKTVDCLQTNADASLISLTCTDQKDMSSRCLYIIDSNSGKVKALENKIGDHYVMAHHWDSVEQKVLICELLFSEGTPPRMMTLFIDHELDAYVHDDTVLESHSSTIVGLSIPHICMCPCAQPFSDNALAPETCKIELVQLAGFEGCSLDSSASISSMTDFLFYVATSHFEKAFMCADQIKIDQVWRKLAIKCIRDENLEVAMRCLQSLCHQKGLPRVEQQGDCFEVALAEAAVQLGMIEEAESLYKKCDRIDLLCDLLRKKGSWSEAFDLAKDDEILLKSLNFLYGKAKEDEGDLSSAFEFYERSSLPRRTLLQKMIKCGIGVDDFLRNQNENKNELISLYALYVESLGDMDQAKQLFSTADDALNSVRIACTEGDLQHAFNLAELERSGSAYYLAQYLEVEGDIDGALKYYTMSGMYNHALRLCKEHECHNLIFDIALKSNAPQMLSCGQYLFELGELLKSARLFMTGGDRGKAIETTLQISFDDINTAQRHEYIAIVDTLDVDIPDETIEQCAKFLIQETESSKNGLGFMKRRGSSIESIVQLCLNENATLDEEGVDLILAGKYEKEHAILVAETCQSQGDLNLACRAFTKAGDRISAARCLLRSGNIQKIVDYANESETRDVYILASNYLQTSHHEQDSQIKKTIVSFYTKAAAYQQLVSLFVGWSEYEAVEGDYEISCRWLEEALKYGQNIDNWNSREECSKINFAVKQMKDFLNARDFVATGSLQEARTICCRLLKDTAASVQAGDCYGLLIEIENDCEKSFGYIAEMRKKKIDPEDYIDGDTIESIYKAVNKEWHGAVIESDDQSHDSLDATGVLVFDEEEKTLLDNVSDRNWSLVRELIDKRGNNVSLRLVCCIFSAGPPQSVAVEVMRIKASIFLERDERDRHVLHYLCLYGASVYTIIFTVQRCKAALYHKDEDNKSPLDHAVASSWEFCQEEKDEVIRELRRIYGSGKRGE